MESVCLSSPPKIHGRTAECEAARCDGSEVTNEQVRNKGVIDAAMVIYGYAPKLPKDEGPSNKDVDGNEGIVTKYLVYARGRIVPCVAEVDLIEGSVFFYIRALLHLHLVGKVCCHHYVHEAQCRVHQQPFLHALTATC
mmetsp:Transcript_5548/g.8170  ORF Transcript_5548/g.8170 Transcript_5548/m.8170 type:complete len:139 (+) Transcript_5548:91-507(+)